MASIGAFGYSEGASRAPLPTLVLLVAAPVLRPLSLPSSVSADHVSAKAFGRHSPPAGLSHSQAGLSADRRMPGAGP